MWRSGGSSPARWGRCLDDAIPTAAAGSTGTVRLHLCTDSGVWLSPEDEAAALALWAFRRSSHDDWYFQKNCRCVTISATCTTHAFRCGRACIPHLCVSISEEDLDGSTKQTNCHFVSPFTLLDELEGIMAHWTDSLVTIFEAEPSAVIRLRREHPTVRPR